MENSGQSNTLRIENLLEECVRRNASDLHLQYGLPPILRVDGVLAPVAGTTAMNEDIVRNLIFAIRSSTIPSPSAISPAFV